jgi:acetyltransferase
MTQIDYEREMAFIATLPLPDGGEEMIGDVRGLGDPDNLEAEFGVLVRSDMKGHRLGWILMDKLIRYLRAHGTERIVGAVLRENDGMLALGRKLGFHISVHPEDPDLRHLELPLQTAQRAP